MKRIDSEAKAALAELLDILVPASMTPAERKTLAAKAGLNPNSLRVGIHRRSLGADTLIRLMLARGISSRSIKQLPQTELAQLSKGEGEWLSLGRQLTDDERVEFSGLVRFMLARWELR